MDFSVLVLGGVSALLASFVSAFAGGGASLILFPLLLLFAPGSYAGLLAITKINASVLTFVSGPMHLKRNSFEWPLFWIILVFGTLGTALGLYFVQYAPNEELFRGLLAVSLFSTAIYLAFKGEIGVHPKPMRRLTWWTGIVTAVFVFLVNILNGLFGGAGVFLTLFLVVYFHRTFIQALTYVVAVYLFLNIAQALYLIATESFSWSLAAAVVVGSAIGAYFGTHLQYRHGNYWVKWAALVVMLLLGIRMVVY